MHSFFPSWVFTLVTTVASLSMASQLFGRNSWSDAGFNCSSTEKECWYQPDKPCVQKTIDPCCCWTDIGVSAFVGVDNFRGIPDADAGDNNGALFGFNVATPLPYLKNHGVGFQLGGSYGAYDFAGRGHTRHNRAIQSQGFLTAGIFIRPQPSLPLSMGIVYDWMFNQNYSIYAENPTLHQLRGQIAYYVTPCDEVGVWGTYDVTKTHKVYKHRTFDYRITYRPISQANLFWRHLFAGGVEATVWLGVPVRHRLNKEHSERPGKYIVGVEMAVPFLDSWALIGRACYMQPGTKSGPLGSKEYTSNIAINVVYYFGGDPNGAEDCACAAWMPYLPVANNCNFFGDAATKVIKHKHGF